jgi:hypothetical protein
MDGRFSNGSGSRLERGDVDVTKTGDKADKEETVAARARQRAIGRELRRLYDDVVQEPVPEDFLDLLKKIDHAQSKKDETA